MASSHRDEISRLELLHAAHPDGLVFPHLADAYRRAGRYAQAETVLEAGLRRHSEYSSAHVVLGRLRMDQGNRAEAETAFRRVLQLDPQNQIALQHLAEIAVDKGRLPEALSLYRKLVRLKPDPGLAARAAELEQRVGRGAEAAGNGHDRAAIAGNGGRRGALSGPSGSPRTPAPAAAVAEPSIPLGGGSVPESSLSPGGGSVPEPGEVVTETMAELYARQGLRRRAAAVYRQLLERNPGDARLRAKLEALGGTLPEGARTQAPVAPGTEPGTEPAGDPASELAREPAKQPAALGAAAGSEPVPRGHPVSAPGHGNRPEPAPIAGSRPEPAPVSGNRLEPAPAVGRGPEPAPAPATDRDRPTIRDQLRGVLAWQPRQVAEPEPAAPSPDRMPAPTSGHAPALEPEQPPARRPEQPSAPRPEQPPAPRPEQPPAAGPEQPIASRPGHPAARRGQPAAGTTEAGRTRAFIALTDMLVGLLEYRDPFFRGSSSLTRLLAASVGEELGLSEEEQVDLSLAAVLRDVGRLALGGKLVAPVKIPPSHEARRRIERHVDLALQLMEGIQLPEPVRLAVRHHHERWDGAGYPDALSGETIPMLARILAVVDSFAAMVSPRPYRLPRKVPEAAAELQEEAGTRYDPEVVNALIRVLARRDQPHLGFVQRHHILMVSPDHPGALVTAAKLCSAGYLAEVAVDPATARERLRRVPVAALVVSAEAGDEAVTSFIRELRGDPLFSSLPVVVVDAGTVGLRVRLLESGADVCFPAAVRHDELQGTVAALLRRTLRAQPGGDGPGAGAEAPWLALQGDVQDFPLTWLLQVMKYDSRTAGIGIRTATREGAIYLRGGDAVHAEIRGGATGEGALREMLQWRKGRFTVQPDARPRKQTISASIMHLLLTQAVDEDHAAAGVFGAVSAES